MIWRVILFWLLGVQLVLGSLPHTTTWNYNQFGWVTNKVDASNHVAFVYSYDANGRLTNRWTPASTNTSYYYDPVGNLTNITYSGSSSSTNSYAFDALNRLTNMIDGVGTTKFTYTAIGQLASESNPFSSLSGTLSFTYSQGLRTALNLTQPSGTTWTETYSYDSAWRLQTLNSPAGGFGYGYPGSASAQVKSISLPNAAYITNTYDSLARLSSTSLDNYWNHVLDGYTYGLDHLGLRTNVLRNFGLTASSVTVGYDNIDQLVSWNAQETNGTSRLNEQIEYGFDAAGNLQSRTSGALAQTFNVDVLNQLSTVTRTGTLTVSGATPAPATNVTVNGNTAQTYADFTFARTNISLSNGSNTFTIIAKNTYGLTVTNVLAVNLPATNIFQFDANGSLTNDGTRTFIYDGENQLTNVNVAGAWKIEFVYDGLRRRRIAREFNWQSGAWNKTNEIRYICDGLLIIHERDSNNVPQVTYTRGLDLSGSLQASGGIGGLLARTDNNGSTFYHADGAGNITALMDANQNLVARYEFDAFGRPLEMLGPMAPVNRIRYSSMPTDPSGLVHFLYRDYNPIPQTFLTADPIGEAGGIPLHGFVGNSPINVIDPLGLDYDPDSFYGIDNRGPQQNTPITQPSFLGSLVPVYGPLGQADYDFSKGNWGWGLANDALAVSDMIPLRSAADALGKGIWKFGSHTWDATRKWLTKCGWREFKGQEMHHWAIPQGGWGKNVPEWLKNQPWNMMGMPDAAFHDALHGIGPDAFNFGERLWYGTPNWLAAGMASTAGREANWMFNPDASGNTGSSSTSFVPLQSGNSLSPVMPGPPN